MAWRADAKRLAQVELGSSPATLYTVPAGEKAIIKEIHLCNHGGSVGPVRPTIWVIPSGDSRGNEHILIPPFRISSLGLLMNVGTTILHAGDKIDAQADVASRCNVNITGVGMVSVT